MALFHNNKSTNKLEPARGNFRRVKFQNLVSFYAKCLLTSSNGLTQLVERRMTIDTSVVGCWFDALNGPSLFCPWPIFVGPFGKSFSILKNFAVLFIWD